MNTPKGQPASYESQGVKQSPLELCRLTPHYAVRPGVRCSGPGCAQNARTRYEIEAKPGQTFQQWLKADRQKAAAKRARLVKTSANSIDGDHA